MQFDYGIAGQSLSRVNIIKDLGVLFDTRLTFRAHMDKICTSGYSVLGFIKRRAKDLRSNDPHLTKTLYFSLVLPILEYANIIWSPYYGIHSNRIESVQKQFLLFALRDLGWNSFCLPSYDHRLLLLEMVPLSVRRESALALLVFDLLSGKINCPSLRARLIPNENTFNLRRIRPFKEEIHVTNYAMNEPMNRAIRTFNELQISPLMGRDKFKKEVLRKLSRNQTLI